MIKQEYSKEDILVKVANPYYGETALEEQLEKYEYYNEPIKGDEKILLTSFAWICIVIGIIYFIINMNDPPRSFIKILLGLLFTGLSLLYFSRRTRSDIDQSKIGNLKKWLDK